MKRLKNLALKLHSSNSILSRLILRIVVAINNRLVAARRRDESFPGGFEELREIWQKAQTPTVISDHLETIFMETVCAKPKLIVELGVEAGSSTFVFERAARVAGATLLSVDFHDCSKVCSWDKWNFVQADDIAFAGRFPDWCTEKGVEPAIDVLFIDTDHGFEHTRKELDAWFPHLNRTAVVLFHDSNLNGLFTRRDGSLGVVRNYNRGVIEAIEKKLNITLDETRDFVEHADGWIIKHHSNCNGLTMLHKMG